MAESGASRQRSSEKEEQRGGQERRAGQLQRSSGGGMQRRGGGGYLPSILAITPRDFLTMSPFGLMRRFTEELDRMFSSLGGSTSGTSLDELAWVPAVEIRQNDNNLVISAELPGLTEKDVRVEATPDGLLIQGERKQESTGEEGGVRRSERVYGQFYRLIPLPEDADVENAQASFENGVLQVTIPIPESQQNRRQIPISGGQGQGQGQSQGQSQGQGQGSSSGQRARSASQSGGS
jgi:HSP20 family protein